MSIFVKQYMYCYANNTHLIEILWRLSELISETVPHIIIGPQYISSYFLNNSLNSYYYYLFSSRSL